MRPERNRGLGLGWEIAWLSAAAILSPCLGVALGARWLFPFISTLTFLPLFLQLLRRPVALALALTLLWGVLHSATSIVLSHYTPQRYEEAVLHGAEYRQEMMHWLETGEGAEGDPRRFLPRHLLHFAAFGVLVAFTRGAGGLFLGVVLLNYMNAYVGALSLRGNPALLALLGWHPWAVLRVAGFLLTAILLIRPMEEGRLRRKQKGWAGVFMLLAGDLLLKWLLASTWRDIINAELGG